MKRRIGIAAAVVMLLAINVGAVAFGLFSNYPGRLLGGGSAAVAADSNKELQVVLRVDGMTCAGCASTVEASLVGMPGVIAATVDVAQSRVVVTVDAQRPPAIDVLIAAVNKSGYQASTFGDGAAALIQLETAADDAPPLHALTGDAAELKKLFNEHDDAVRLVTLLSPS